MHRIPSELCSEACLGESSTRMGDLPGKNHVGPTALHLDWPKQMIYGNASDVLTGAIIQALMHRIPSELCSEACLGESSTRMGDLPGSPRVAPFFIIIFILFFGLKRV
ncbi:hypothetical protein Bca101_102264 [Brassica carinata]